MPTSRTRILCILSTLLGNRKTTERLLQAVGRIPDAEAIPVIIESDDYQKYPAPWWAKLSNPWEVRHIARRKSARLQGSDYDMLLVNSWENVIEFGNAARRVPALGLFDTAPATLNFQLRGRGLGGWKRQLSYAVHSSAFRRAVSNFDCLLPMGSDCAASLVKDYGCPPDRCFITLAPQELDFWSPAPRTSGSRLHLLFVGNDFERKGGAFLLNLYSTYLAPFCLLTIASNDPAIGDRSLPEGVTLLRGLTRDQMLAAYRESDLFLFPSLQDFMPQVIAEALATGLPCVANDVGGICDLVHSGETGFLMSREDGPESWARRIKALMESPQELDRLSAGARRFAENHLGIDRFERLIADSIERLRVTGKVSGGANSGRLSVHLTATDRN